MGSRCGYVDLVDIMPMERTMTRYIREPILPSGSAVIFERLYYVNTEDVKVFSVQVGGRSQVVTLEEERR